MPTQPAPAQPTHPPNPCTATLRGDVRTSRTIRFVKRLRAEPRYSRSSPAAALSEALSRHAARAACPAASCRGDRVGGFGRRTGRSARSASPRAAATPRRSTARAASRPLPGRAAQATAPRRTRRDASRPGRTFLIFRLVLPRPPHQRGAPPCSENKHMLLKPALSP